MCKGTDVFIDFVYTISDNEGGKSGKSERSSIYRWDHSTKLAFKANDEERHVLADVKTAL